MGSSPVSDTTVSDTTVSDTIVVGANEAVDLTLQFLDRGDRGLSAQPLLYTEDGVVTTSSDNVLGDDHHVQRIAIEVNRMMGDYQLELLGSHNPDFPSEDP